MKKFAIWGTGQNANIYYYWLSGMDILKYNEIVCFVDNDEKKQGLYKEKPVIAASDLCKYEYDYISIWSTKYEKEIRKQIIEELKVSGDRIRDIFLPYKQLLYTKYGNSEDLEIRNILEGLRKQQGLDVFYFDRKNDNKKLNEAYYDVSAGLYYTIFEGKRMYLKRSYGYFREINGKRYVGDMWGEQDPNSPHLYEEGSISVEQGDILVDAGVCEGNFTLHNIDKIRKAYLVECDKGWMEALEYTFRPYKNKIQYCNKFLSNYDSDETICLDTLISDTVNFIKMDIEGEEVNALRGAKRVLDENNHMKCAICSYHRHDDEYKIKQVLHSHGFNTEVSKGYMLFISDNYVQKNPELRRGVVRGEKLSKVKMI